MQCAQCGVVNPADMNFCEECGARLVRRCPSCGYEVKPATKFCGKCGASLTGGEDGKREKGEKGEDGLGSSVQSPHPPASSTQSPVSYTPPHLAERIRAEQIAMESHGATDGERKTITVLF